MQSITVSLKNRTGLHARPAAVLTRVAARYKSQMFIVKDGKNYNLKSIMGVLSLGASMGEELQIMAEGEDETEAISAVKTLIDNNFVE
ncbi:MAG: HPr family phosphocarrier protein [Bacillota bacterium]